MTFDWNGMSIDLGTIETVAAIVASGAVILGGLYVMIQNIRAASYSKPVVDAKEMKFNADISSLRIQNAQQQGTIDKQGSEITNLKELVTNAAKVDALREESIQRFQSNIAEHRQMMEGLAKVVAAVSISNRLLIAVAHQMGVDVRKTDETEQ